MSFFVAGIAGVLAFLVGAMSCMVIPWFTVENENICDDGRGFSGVPVACSHFFSIKNKSQILRVCAMALVCAIAAYFATEDGGSVLTLCRQGVAMFTLLSVMYIDRETHRIPNIIVVTAMAAGTILLLVGLLVPSEKFVPSLLTSVFGACGCLILFYLLSRITKDGIGMGDVKLITTLGWLLGMASALFIVLISMLLCSFYAITMLLRKKKGRNDVVPFGPFLFFGYIIFLLLISI